MINLQNLHVTNSYVAEQSEWKENKYAFQWDACRLLVARISQHALLPGRGCLPLIPEGGCPPLAPGWEVSASGPGGWYPSMHWADHPPCERND